MRRSYHWSSYHRILASYWLNSNWPVLMFHSHHDGRVINFGWIWNHEQKWWIHFKSLKIFQFWLTYLSRFFIDKLRSTFSIKLSNQWAIVCCLSSGWDRMILSFIDLILRGKGNFSHWTWKIDDNECQNRHQPTWSNLRITKSTQVMVSTMTTDSCNPRT